MIDLLDTDDLDAPLRAKAWKNRLFLISGRSLWAKRAWPSEAAARRAIIDADAWIKTLHPDTWVVDTRTFEHLFRLREYSHAIPLPWQEDQP